MSAPRTIVNATVNLRRARGAPTPRPEESVIHEEPEDVLETCPPLRPTQTLPGYELLEELGRGGMGVVYKARQLSLARMVAVKMILAAEHASTIERSRFRQEAEAIAALHHPNIVQVYESGEHAGLPFLVLEYVEGITLARRLDRRPLPPVEAVRLTEALARAVHAAHEHGIIHRDLKPANVLLASGDSDGVPRSGRLPAKRDPGGEAAARVVPKITDFGLAKRLDCPSNLTGEGHVVGTPAYMAPEQLSGERTLLGPAVDIHALGVVLYEMLTGRPPFLADSPAATLNRVAVEIPVSPRRLQPSVSRDLETICLKCLEKRPDRRYPTAAALADDLRNLQEGRLIVARPLGPLGRGWSWCRRNPAVATLLLLVVATLTLGTVVSLSFALRSAEKATEAEQLAELYLEQKGIAEDNATEADVQTTLARAAQSRAQEAGHVERRLKEEAVQREANLKRQLYATRMNLLQRSWEQGETNHVLRFLTLTEPTSTSPGERPAFEWQFFHRLAWSSLRHAAFPSLTNGAAVVAAPDGTSFLWAVGERVLKTTHEASPSPTPWDQPGVTAVACDPATGEFLTGSTDGVIVFWTPEGKRLREVRTDSKPLRTLGLVKGHNLLVTGSWHPPTHAMTGEVALRDRTTGAALQRWAGIGVALSPDGALLAVVTPHGQVQVKEAATGKEIRTLATAKEATCAVFGPHRSLLAIGTVTGDVVVCDPTRGHLPPRELRGPTERIMALAFSPDGQTLAGGGGDSTIVLWDLRTGQPMGRRRGHFTDIRGLAFSNDGTELASVGVEGLMLLWDPHQDPERMVLAEGLVNVEGLLPLPDGVSLLVPTREMPFPLVNLQGKSLVGQTPDLGLSRVGGADLDHQGRLLVVGTNQGVSFVRYPEWEIARPALPTEQAVTRVALSPNGRLLATGHQGTTVQVYQLPTATPLRTFTVANGPQVAGLKFTPDGARLMALGGVGAVQVWEIATGREITSIVPPKSVVILDAALSPDGNSIALAFNDGTARLHDATTGEERMVFSRHGKLALGVAFSPDGQRLATAGLDRTVKLWDLTTGLETLNLRTPNLTPRRLAFLANGEGLTAATEEGTVLFWDARNGKGPARHR